MAIPFLDAIVGVGSFLKSNGKLVVGAVLAAGLAFFVWQYDARGREIALQKAEIVRLEGDLKSAKEQAEIQKVANAEVVKRLQEREQETRRLTEVIEKAKNAPETKNGPVAPVLDDALDGIERSRMRGHGKTDR